MAELPFVFLDRSLGRLQVPQLLRAAGVELVTLAEHYGIPADEDVKDATWIRDSAQRGWIAFMKDFAIKRRPVESEAIRDYRARCFCLPNANLKAAAMAERYITNIDRIAAQPSSQDRCSTPSTNTDWNASGSTTTDIAPRPNGRRADARAC